MQLTAYQTVPPAGYEIIPAGHRRDWMDDTHDRSAYRCLPMLVANQAGWMILNPGVVRVKWDGGVNIGAVELQRWQPANSQHTFPDYVWPTSHFGSGIVTWTLPWLFRTPPGYNLLVRGPANSPKDGISALEGIVETDWATATFTMNWKITRKDTWIAFERGEPLCMIVPQKRGELEQFTPEILSIGDDTELQASYDQWCKSRDTFNFQRRHEEAWEKHYFKGTHVDGSVASEHQTKLRLQHFTRGSS